MATRTHTFYKVVWLASATRIAMNTRIFIDGAARTWQQRIHKKLDL
jgi:hypothetical protein